MDPGKKSQSPPNQPKTLAGQPNPRPPRTGGQFVELASSGKVGEAQIKKFLDDYPTIAAETGNLANYAELAWLQKISRANPLVFEGARRQVPRMKRELAGESPAPVEKLLIDRIVVCYLAAQYAEIVLATSDSTTGIQMLKYLAGLAESANRRYLAAIKSLAVVRRLTNGLNIQISHNYATSGPGGRPEPEGDLLRAREKIHGALAEATAREKGIVAG